MSLTVPSLTISTLSPRTCARSVSSFCWAWSQKQDAARMPFSLESLGTVSFAQLTPSGNSMPPEGNVPLTS